MVVEVVAIVVVVAGAGPTVQPAGKQVFEGKLAQPVNAPVEQL